MKRTLIISILILNAITLAAIKPNRVYSYTPDKLDLTYEEFKVKTDDCIFRHMGLMSGCMTIVDSGKAMTSP